jgi:hypothetical protein
MAALLMLGAMAISVFVPDADAAPSMRDGGPDEPISEALPEAA